MTTAIECLARLLGQHHGPAGAACVCDLPQGHHGPHRSPGCGCVWEVISLDEMQRQLDAGEQAMLDRLKRDYDEAMRASLLPDPTHIDGLMARLKGDP